VVSAGDVAHSKPAPDCYQTVLRRLQERGLDGLRSAECVVLEDARHGIVAAKAAGMRCVAVTTSYAPEALGAADRIVSGLDSLTLSMLEELVMQEEDKGKRNNP
jgi:beta-phosphoglucomutase-like phosphatase (HAD superfamily)